MMFLKKIKVINYIVVGICIILGVLFHGKYINEYPSYIHAWAQADHFAITLGFLDNGLNFFKPQTLIFNHQFPDWWSSTTETGITSVDFPIHHYIPAVIMDVLGIRAPIVSRLYLFFYSIIGLFGIYKLTYLLSNNHLRSIFVMIFASTLPVYVFYQAGFFPSIPSLANTLLGVYFYVKYLKQFKDKYFYISILLLTLAALSRTTFVIPLIAIFGNEFLRVIFKKTLWKTKIIPLLCSVLVIIGYFFYNKYLRETYSSIFIGYLLPPESLLDFWNILKYVFSKWHFQYLSIYHYGFTLVLLISVFFVRKNIKLPHFINGVFSFISILLFGLLLFLIAMSEAFINHDYYFIDTFYLPLIILISIGCSYFPMIKNRMLRSSFNGLFIGLVVMFCINSYHNQKSRRIINDYDLATKTKINYEGSNEFLTSLGISKGAKILAIDVYAPNVPFVMMDRRGHGVFYPTKENIEKAFTWDFDYVVTQNRFFLDETYQAYPEILNHLSVIGNNGRITVSKYHKEEITQTLEHYLLDKLDHPFLVEVCDFEHVNASEWSNVIIADSLMNGNSVGEMKTNELYGITLKKQNLENFTLKSCMMKFSARVFLMKGLTSKYVLRLRENNTEVYSKTFTLSDYIDTNEIGVWQDLKMVTMLPIINSNNNELSLFLWNPDKGNLYIDDIRVELY